MSFSEKSLKRPNFNLIGPEGSRSSEVKRGGRSLASLQCCRVSCFIFLWEEAVVLTQHSKLCIPVKVVTV